MGRKCKGLKLTCRALSATKGDCGVLSKNLSRHSDRSADVLQHSHMVSDAAAKAAGPSLRRVMAHWSCSAVVHEIWLAHATQRARENILNVRLRGGEPFTCAAVEPK